MELDESSTLQWFGQKIGNHLFCWAVLHNEITVVDAVYDKEVAHVQMSCELGAQQSAILLKKDNTLIVLIKDCFLEIETLCMKKVICPKQEWHGIIGGDELGLGGTLSVELLLEGAQHDHAFA